MNHLPVDDILPELLQALNAHRRVILRAPPGSGKTTRVSSALLDAALTGDKDILLLQPRRAAARSIARYLARLHGVQVGEEIGYQVRFDARVSKRTRLHVITEGILINRLQGDAELSGVGAVVFDEFHERSLNADLGLGLIREVQETIRPDLNLVVMSATLDVDPISRYLAPCPVIETRGRAHPVTIEFTDEADDRPVAHRAAGAVRRLTERMKAGDAPPGHVLVFLPGRREIETTLGTLASWARDGGWEVLPLHGSLDSAAQDAALSASDKPRVIVSTNIAETSLTIDGVTVVVDSGLVRVLRQDRGVGLDRLELERTSRASSEQRAGRAGRQQPGIACRVYPAAEERTRAAETDAEIRRVDLSGLVLQLAAWGVRDPASFPLLEPPPDEALAQARELLTLLGALEADGRLSKCGLEMSRMPAHPRIARMLLAARAAQLVSPAAWAAALLQSRPLKMNADESRVGACDLSAQLQTLTSGQQRPLMRSLAPVAAQLARCVGAEAESLQQALKRLPPDGLGRLVLAGWPDRVCRRVEEGGQDLRMVGGRGARLHPSSCVRDDTLLVAPSMDGGRRGERSRARIWMACGVEESWLQASGLCVEAESLSWDGERVVATRTVSYRDLVLEERPLPLERREEASGLLAEAVARDPERALRLNERDQAVLQRMGLVAEHMPDLGLPPNPHTWLLNQVPALCAGATSLAELRARPAGERLLALLPWDWRETLNRHAPTSWLAPSGGKIGIHYPEDGPPKIEVKIQELFGLAHTPRIAGGRLALSLHLLNPAGRPVQVTSDLESFWSNTWPEVRREMRSRYPKHRWPEDPTTAAPSRNTLKRRGGDS